MELCLRVQGNKKKKKNKKIRLCCSPGLSVCENPRKGAKPLACVLCVSCRELLGPRLHFEALVGAQSIREEQDSQQQQQQAKQEVSPPAASRKDVASAAEGAAPALNQDSEHPDAVEWTRHKPAVGPPWGAGTLTTPVALRVDSPTLSCQLAGWSTTRGFTYLAQPVRAQVQLTPKMAG